MVSFCETVLLQKEVTECVRERANPDQRRRTFAVADGWSGALFAGNIGGREENDRDGAM